MNKYRRPFGKVFFENLEALAVFGACFICTKYTHYRDEKQTPTDSRGIGGCDGLL